MGSAQGPHTTEPESPQGGSKSTGMKESLGCSAENGSYLQRGVAILLSLCFKKYTHANHRISLHLKCF